MRSGIGDMEKEECSVCNNEATVECDECNDKFCNSCKWHDCFFGREYTFSKLD